MDLKDAAKVQLKKTLNDLRREEFEKLDKKLEAKEEMKRVENAMINREDPDEGRKRSFVEDQVNMLREQALTRVSISRNSRR